MNRLRDEPLAGARLAGQENRAVGSSHRLDHLEDVEHRRAAADDVRELVREAERPLEQDVLLLELTVVDLLANLHLQQVDVERLAQVVARAQPHRLDGRVRGGKGGDHDAEDVLIDALRGAKHVHAAQVGHLDVRDQQVDRLPLDQGDRLAAVLGEEHVVALPLQDDRQQLAHRPLVVGDEDARSAALGRDLRRLGIGLIHVVTSARAGRRTETAVPSPGRELTLDLPVVVGDDAVDDGEAEAAALREAAVKGLEQPVEFVRRDADALVAHGDHEALADRIGPRRST